MRALSEVIQSGKCLLCEKKSDYQLKQFAYIYNDYVFDVGCCLSCYTSNVEFRINKRLIYNFNKRTK